MISFTGLLDLLQQRKFMSETVNLFCSELYIIRMSLGACLNRICHTMWRELKLVNTIMTLVGFFFQTSFFNLFAFTEIVVQAIRFILERSSKESSGTCI